MKVKLLIVVLVFFAFTAKAQIGTRDYLTTNGFDGFHLGDTITKIPKEKLILLSTNEKYNILTYAYTDTGALKITDKIKLKKITVVYGRGRLGEVIFCYNKQDEDTIHSLLDKLYGTSDKPNYGIADYQNSKADMFLSGKNKDGDYVMTLGGPDE